MTTESLNRAKTVFADLEFLTGCEAKQPPYLKEDYVWLYTEEEFAEFMRAANKRGRR